MFSIVFHHCIMFFLAALEDLRSGAGEGTTQLEGKLFQYSC